ncbi:two-component system activity regulator YycH [Bacillus sp. NPDC077027]|uniref:two-component system activity regulator YycH n=1 Tax=Bacillus sp. NPDC077027 TaxID=3390548 RepID=UPI003D0669E0
MKRETFKTIILTILIAISLVFTWNIWMFQPVMQDQADSSTTVVEKKKISSDEPRSLIDVVKPREMFVHTGGEHYKVDNKELFNNLWNDVSLWDVKNIEDVSDQFSEQKFKNFFYGQENEGKTLDLVFNDPVPIDIFQSLFKWPNQSIEYNSFDRMIVPFSQQNKANKKVYLVSYSKESVIELTIESANYRNLMSSITEDQSSMPRYDLYTFSSNSKRDFLLPRKQVSLESKMFFIETIKTSKFKDALFTEPSLVGEESNLNRTVYTDGTSRLEANQNERRIQYQHRNINSSTVFQTGDLIKRSVRYFNDTGSFTDDYQYFGINSNQQLSFNMCMDGLPIVNSTKNPFGMTSLEVQWANDDILNYKRPNYILGNKASQSEQVKLMNGTELEELLKEQTKYDLEKIEQIFPAYQAVSKASDHDQAPFVWLQPVWCMKYNGKIVNLTKDLLVEGSEKNGVE